MESPPLAQSLQARNSLITSATAEDRRYCANLTYPNADDHISLSDSRSVAVERLAQLVGSGLGRRVRIALVAGIRGAAQAVHEDSERAKAKQAWSEAQREEASLEAMSAELQQTQQSIAALQRGHGQGNRGQKAAETQRPADMAL